MKKAQNKPKLPKISQSLLKAFGEYLKGELCGIIFNRKYVLHDLEEQPSEAMELGNYFEYAATGAIPRNGIIPRPVKTAGQLSAAYKRVQQSVMLFNKMKRRYNVEILDISLKLDNGVMDGIIDIYAKMNGVPVFIDTKYSGLLDDKWSEVGWYTDNLPERDKLMFQGVQYKILADTVLGIKNIPFYFWVFDSKNPLNAKVILEEVDEDSMAHYMEMVNITMENLAKEMTRGFKPHAKYSRCIECPLLLSCEHASPVPEIEVVHYTTLKA